MGSGHMLLTVLALVLLGFVLLTMNRSMVNTSEQNIGASVGLNAVSLAESFFESAQRLRFDEKDLTDPAVSNAGDLTPADLLGPDAGESQSNVAGLDDIDDFNGFNRDTTLKTVSDLTGMLFHIQARVCYVQPEQPWKDLTARTFNKRMDVTITSSLLPAGESLQFQHVFSHWRQFVDFTN